MLLSEIGKYLTENEKPDYHSTLQGSLDVSDVTEKMIDRCGSVAYLLDRSGHAVSQVSKDTLYFLQKNYSQCNFTDILDHISDGVIAVDATGRIFYLNRAYINIFKVKPYKVIGRHIQVVEPNSLLSRVVSTHREVHSERTRVASVKRYVSLHIYPLFDRGAFAGAVSIFRDVTEACGLQGEVEKMNSIIKSLSTRSNRQIEKGIRPLVPVADGTMDDMLSACEKYLMSTVLKEEGGNRTRTMARLGMSRRTFYRKYAEYELGEPDTEE